MDPKTLMLTLCIIPLLILLAYAVITLIFGVQLFPPPKHPHENIDEMVEEHWRQGDVIAYINRGQETLYRFERKDGPMILLAPYDGIGEMKPIPVWWRREKPQHAIFYKKN